MLRGRLCAPATEQREKGEGVRKGSAKPGVLFLDWSHVRIFGPPSVHRDRKHTRIHTCMHMRICTHTHATHTHALRPIPPPPLTHRNICETTLPPPPSLSCLPYPCLDPIPASTPRPARQAVVVPAPPLLAANTARRDNQFPWSGRCWRL